MLDDAGMDRLLAASLAGDVPHLSQGFDERVMRQVRRRRLTRAGRVALAVYAVAASAATAWALAGLGPGVIAAGLGMVGSAAAGTSAYARHLTRRV